MVIYCLKWPLGPQGFSTLNFESYSVAIVVAIVFGIVERQPKGYVPDFFEKPPLVHRKGINQDPKIYIYISYMYYILIVI